MTSSPEEDERVLVDHVREKAFPCGHGISSCHKVRSSRPSGGGFPALVADDLTWRHEELCDHMGILFLRHVQRADMKKYAKRRFLKNKTPSSEKSKTQNSERLDKLQKNEFTRHFEKQKLLRSIKQLLNFWERPFRRRKLSVPLTLPSGIRVAGRRGCRHEPIITMETSPERSTSNAFAVCVRTENENLASFSFWSTWDFCSH